MTMTTVKFDAGSVQMIAHRGVSDLERENTAAAFVAAGNRSYFGIESDVHVTADGQYIIIHDDRTGRVADRNIPVEGSTLKELRALRLTDLEGNPRADLCFPTLEEYVHICRHYGKTAVIELKNNMTAEHIQGIYDVFKSNDYLQKTVFITFCYNNLVLLRQIDKHVAAQFLIHAMPPQEQLLSMLTDIHVDLDTHFQNITPAFVSACHERGIKVNVWTVDSLKEAARVRDAGVDYITTNILE